MGVDIKLEGGYVEMKCNGRLKGARVNFRFASVGATENILLAAVLADGTTVIENAAKEPEITDLADVLIKMGAKIKGAGTSTITVEGVEKLSGFKHRVIPDRIETATYLIAAAMTEGDVTLENTDASLIKVVIEKLEKSGLFVECSDNTIHAVWKQPLKPISVKTAIYPGFPTDVQAQWMALMAVVEGSSTIEETVFENRFLHAVELQRLGAQIAIDGNTVHVKGVPELSGAPVMVSDLRAGAALVLSGLVARGKTEVLRIYHLDRGYEDLEKKLRKLGASIRRVKA
jgi:UDP-N-acetylglucosamine 1-carboxyvinyltransferase